MIAATLPRVGVGHTFPLMRIRGDAAAMSGLIAALSSFVFDYVARQKVGGTHLTYGYFVQLPVPRPDMLGAGTNVLTPRVLELIYTAIDLSVRARSWLRRTCVSLGPERRAVIRAELDASMFRLYGMAEDVNYILETFPIVRRKDVQRFDEYRTKRLILECYDAMVAAEAAGVKYETPLDPPPGVQRRRAHA